MKNRQYFLNKAFSLILSVALTEANGNDDQRGKKQFQIELKPFLSSENERNQTRIKFIGRNLGFDLNFIYF